MKAVFAAAALLSVVAAVPAKRDATATSAAALATSADALATSAGALATSAGAHATGKIASPPDVGEAGTAKIASPSDVGEAGTGGVVASPSDVSTELPLSVASCLAHAQTAQFVCPPFDLECFCQDSLITEYLVSCIGTSASDSSDFDVAKDYFADYCSNTPTGSWSGANQTFVGGGN